MDLCVQNTFTKKIANAFKNQKDSDIFQFCNVQIPRWL